MRKPTVTNFYSTKEVFDACNRSGNQPAYPYEEVPTPYGPVSEMSGADGVKIVFLSEHNTGVLDNWYRVDVADTPMEGTGRLDLASEAHGPIEQVFYWFNMVEAEPPIGKVGVNVLSWTITPPEHVEITDFGRIIRMPITKPSLSVNLEDAVYFENEADAVAWRMQW